MTPNMRATMQWLASNGFMCSGCDHCRKGSQMQKLVDSLATRRTLTAYLEKNATVTLECLPEDLVIVGNASAIDPETDRQQEQWIRDQLNAGNDWAWCLVVITVSYGGFSATDSLGACSYESEASFRECMLHDMVHCCCVDLVAQLFEARETLARAWELANVGH